MLRAVCRRVAVKTGCQTLVSARASKSLEWGGANPLGFLCLSGKRRAGRRRPGLQWLRVGSRVQGWGYLVCSHGCLCQSPAVTKVKLKVLKVSVEKYHAGVNPDKGSSK